MGGLKGTIAGAQTPRAVRGEAAAAPARRGERGSSRAHKRILLTGSPYRSWTRRRRNLIWRDRTAGGGGGQGSAFDKRLDLFSPPTFGLPGLNPLGSQRARAPIGCRPQGSHPGTEQQGKGENGAGGNERGQHSALVCPLGGGTG